MAVAALSTSIRPYGRPMVPRTSSVPSASSISSTASSDLERLKRMSAEELRNLGASNKSEFFRVLRAAAEESERVYGVPAEVTLAQAALESGWGKSEMGGYNLFGMKGVGPAGYVLKSTKEWDGSKYITVQAKFAKYHNFYEAVVEHGKRFHNGYYDKAVQQYAKDHDYKNFIQNIQGIYATDPQYSNKLNTLIDQYGLAAPQGSDWLAGIEKGLQRLFEFAKNGVSRCWEWLKSAWNRLQ
ncbi:MAG: glycoside hydrolase family 73 protein [Bacteroidota bacterium]